MSKPLSSRLATPADIPALKVLMERSISLLLPAFLSPEEVAASHEVMGLDTQLIVDGTYFVIEADGVIAGCGGWSRRATLLAAITPAGVTPLCSIRRRRPHECGPCTPTRTSRGAGWGV